MPELAKPSAPTAKLVTVEPTVKEQAATTYIEVTTTPSPQTQRFTKPQLEQRKAMLEKQVENLTSQIDTVDEQLALFQ